VLPDYPGLHAYRHAMRVLHIVDRDAEAGRVVLETSDGPEQFELSIDQTLREALREAPAVAATAATAPRSDEPRITPREIQTRVRAGASGESIATEFNAGLDWVLRFAAPVLDERARMADDARRAKARRSTTEGQTVVFGEAVDERFAAHGIDPTSVRWDAHRRPDGQWIISARWIGGQDEHEAQWSFHRTARTVAPIDDAAADLLSDRPVRPLAPAAPDAEPALTLAPPLAPGLVAFPAMPDAHTGPLPRAEEVFDQAKYDHDKPHLPLNLPETTPLPKVTNLGVAHRDDESEDARAARATIPSWDDILLGVRRKHD
jgi:hypothetical protein